MRLCSWQLVTGEWVRVVTGPNRGAAGRVMGIDYNDGTVLVLLDGDAGHSAFKPTWFTRRELEIDDEDKAGGAHV